MNMKNEDVIDRLRLLMTRLKGLEESDTANHLRIVGIDLFEYIQSVPQLKEEWDKRVLYFHYLQSDSEYRSMEMSAIDTCKRLAMTVQKVLPAPSPDRKYFLPSKGEGKKFPISEILSFCLEPKKYLNLQMAEDIKRSMLRANPKRYVQDGFSSGGKIIGQFRYLLGIFSDFLPHLVPRNSSIMVLLKDFVTDARKLDELIALLEKKLMTVPSQLRVDCFEMVLSVAAKYLPSNIFAMLSGNVVSEDDKSLITHKIRQAGLDVCDVLIWECTQKKGSSIVLVKANKSGRPPKFSYLDGRITDGQKQELIPKNKKLVVRLCKAILDITDGKEEISIDALYGSYMGETEEGWDALDKDTKEKFRKFIKNHVPTINHCLSERGYSPWIERETNKIIRLY